MTPRFFHESCFAITILSTVIFHSNCFPVAWCNVSWEIMFYNLRSDVGIPIFFAGYLSMEAYCEMST